MADFEANFDCPIDNCQMDIVGINLANDSRHAIKIQNRYSKLFEVAQHGIHDGIRDEMMEMINANTKKRGIFKKRKEKVINFS